MWGKIKKIEHNLKNLERDEEDGMVVTDVSKLKKLVPGVSSSGSSSSSSSSSSSGYMQ